MAYERRNVPASEILQIPQAETGTMGHKTKKMKPIKLGESLFKEVVVMEHSFTDRVEKVGKANNTMTLWRTAKDRGFIHWSYDIIGDASKSGEVEIGLWFDGRRVIDYDGVFSLPKEAVSLLKRYGFIYEEA